MTNDITLSQSDFGALAICAIRYCHGRMSYMPDMVRGIIRPYLDRISDKDLNIMLEDCEFQRRTEMYGDERIDKPAWLKCSTNSKRKRREETMELPINTWAHRLMVYIPVGLKNAERIGGYNIIYHGDRLYSIRRVDKDAVVLLHADSPHDAWRKAVKMYGKQD